MKGVLGLIQALRVLYLILRRRLCGIRQVFLVLTHVFLVLTHVFLPLIFRPEEIFQVALWFFFLRCWLMGSIGSSSLAAAPANYRKCP